MQHGAARDEATVEPPPLQDDVAALIFTSGTTGAPKGVMVTHEALIHFARVSAASRGLGPQDRCYAFVPMTHIFGLATVLLTSLHAGAQLVLRPQFDPQDLLDGKKPAASGLKLGWICSFNIPIITICAFIVLNIFLSLFDLFFRWMMFIKVCIPFPKKGGGEE